MSSHTTSGMQQKAGTNFEGPRAVEAPRPPAAGWGQGASIASLAQNLQGATIEAKKATTGAVAPAGGSAAASGAAAAPAAPTVASAVTSLPGHPNLSLLVLDSGAFISSGSASLHSTSAGFELLARLYRENDAQLRFVTTASVMAELRDEKTRQMLASLPFPIEVVSVDPEAIKECYRFASLTGDAKSLSATDIQIIALTYQMEKQHNGMMFIKTEPRRSQAMDAAPAVTPAPAAATAAPDSAPSVAEPAASAPSASSDSAASAAPAQSEEREEHESDEDAEEEAEVAAAPAPEEKQAEVPAADDDGEGAWITPSNLHQHRRPAATKPTEPESSIGVLTTDYAMQNVLLQMGLRLLNLRGRSIRSIRSWMKKCHACGSLCADMSRDFCAHCGHHTLIRVNVTVNRAGRVRHWHGSRHLNLRGTVYSIPMPRAGRHANNLKLSEDTVDDNIRKGAFPGGRGTYKAERTPAQLFEEAAEFGLHRVGPASAEGVHGYGRRNPNAVKGGLRKKKGKR